MKGTHKHTEASLICFDNHRCLYQLEDSKRKLSTECYKRKTWKGKIDEKNFKMKQRE